MKQLLISLALFSLAICAKLDNKYLPAKPDPFINGGVSESDLRAATPLVHQSAISDQYSSAPNGQFGSASSQTKYLPPQQSQFASGSYKQVGFSGSSSPNFGASTSEYQHNNQFSSPSSSSFQNQKLTTFGNSLPSSFGGQHPSPGFGNQQPSSSFGNRPGYDNHNIGFSTQSSENTYKNKATQYSGQYPGQKGQYSGQYGGSSQQPTNIIRYDNNPNGGDGSYVYNYETENGISAQEEGSVHGDNAQAQGGYTYTSPEGEQISVQYVADENGYQPKGSHIPEIPEAIKKSLELNKAAEARGEHDDGEYHEEVENFEHSQYGSRQNSKPQYGGATQSNQNSGFRGSQSQFGSAGSSQSYYGGSSAPSSSSLQRGSSQYTAPKSQYGDSTFQRATNSNFQFESPKSQFETASQFKSQQTPTTYGSSSSGSVPNESHDSVPNDAHSRTSPYETSKSSSFSGSFAAQQQPTFGTQSQFGTGSSAPVGYSNSYAKSQFGGSFNTRPSGQSQYGARTDSSHTSEQQYTNDGGYKY